MRRWAEAEEYYERALIAYDSVLWQAFQGLCAVQFAQGDTAAALATAEAYGEKLPDHPEVHWLRAHVAATTLEYPATFAHLDAMREAGRGAVTFEREWARYTARSYVALGRLAEAERISMRREEADREQGDADEALLQVIRRASWASQFRSRNDEAATLLDDALERYPLTEIVVQDRPYHELIQGYARIGRLDRARGLFEEWEREVPASLRSDEMRYLTRGLLALSEGEAAAAVEAIRTYYDEESCLACALYPLGRAYDAAGETDSAVAVLSRGLDLNDPYRYGTDPLWRAATLIRVGELHEARGEVEPAIARYAELIELWTDADHELQEIVQDIRDRITRLVAEPQR
jgi:tetratricopeptide (TPR) repeat protein